MFNIEISLAAISDAPLARGRIQLDDFSESFECSLEFWKSFDYQRQWREAVARLLEGASKSCLITSITDPKTANFFIWWPIYNMGETVAVQNHVCMLDSLSEVFDLDALDKHVPDREIINEDGHCISEWLVDMTSLRYWLKSQSI